jgi:hypothetical protein
MPNTNNTGNGSNNGKGALPSFGAYLQSDTSYYLFTAIFFILMLVGLYYLYKYLYEGGGMSKTTIIGSQIPANKPTDRLIYDIPPPYEGGEYSVNLWMYITGWKDRMGLRKHILEIQGKQFSTMLLGLGAHKNSLMVRVHTKGSEEEVSNGTDLSKENVKTMFEQMGVENSMLDTHPMCDLPMVDLQRWTMVTVVLNGRTCDVYIDGKLTRSCVLPSFFKVDPNGVGAKLVDYNGFDGFVSDVSFSQKAMNPEEIYKMYMAGPSTEATGIKGWLKSIFNVEGTLIFNTPEVSVKYKKNTVNL